MNRPTYRKTDLTATTHHYQLQTTWQGADNFGTRSYESYQRHYQLEWPGKPVVQGSADPAFRGNPQRPNPEELLLGAVSACHMLFYLALCAKRGVCVLSYQDSATGVLELRPDGGGAFSSLHLRPEVCISADSNLELARVLHQRANELCFIARSCAIPIQHSAIIRHAAASPNA